MKRFSKEWFRWFLNKYDRYIMFMFFIIGWSIGQLINTNAPAIYHYISYGLLTGILIFIIVRLLIIYKKK